MKEISGKCCSVNALKYQPHFSLRGDFKIKETDLAVLYGDLEDVVRSYGRVTIKLNRFGFYPWRIIYLDIPRENKLQSLHEDLMSVIQKYRTSWVPEVLLDSKHFDGRQREYIKEYGYQFAFEYFSPHFTMAGNDMTEEKYLEVKKELEGGEVDVEVVIDRVALFDRNSDNRVLQEFILHN